MKKAVLFDFDGTLCKSADTIREAYILAGAPEDLAHDTDVLRQTWLEWLVPAVGREEGEAIWHRKNKIYARLLRDAPMHEENLRVARRLDEEGYLCGILTGAPLEADRVLRTSPHLTWARLLLVQCTPAFKIQVMRTLGPGGVYVDDQWDIKDDVEKVGWRFAHANSGMIELLARR